MTELVLILYHVFKFTGANLRYLNLRPELPESIGIFEPFTFAELKLV